ncbi:MAG: hypothetical protein QOH21_259 [Acidobacteriota bacterium]|jgi:hypothetical protein|nr:hypothetical protein [Acidobacteriota bacterium]
MKRLIVVLLVVFTAMAVFADRGPVKLVIKAAAKKQPPVTFAHEKHAKLAKSCDTCHHTQKGLKSDTEKVVKCTTCHLDPKKPNIPSMREMSMTKNPFHIRCISCHKAQKKGPTACAACHAKAK